MVLCCRVCNSECRGSETLVCIGTAASSPLHDSLMLSSGTSGLANRVSGAKGTAEAAVPCVCAVCLEKQLQGSVESQDGRSPRHGAVLRGWAVSTSSQ